MAVINPNITETDLRDLFDAGLAVFENDPKYSEDEAIRTANDFAYGVWRNLLTLDGYRAWLINRAKLLQGGIQ